MLRAAGDPTRLRLLLLLRQAELTVSELIEIIGQSQPRVSRHLKLLCGAGLIERFKEGSWVFCRATEDGNAAALTASLAALLPGPPEGDLKRLAAVREARAIEAAAYFKANASEWSRIRSLHAPEREVEEAIVRKLGNKPIQQLLDAGTGTGRMLEVLAPLAKRAVGVDVSSEMLAIARDTLMRSQLNNVQVRLADTYRLPFESGNAQTGFDTVIFHQVLHYLDDPAAAVQEAGRVMQKGGRLLIADFAPHSLEFLRQEFAHRRLGFSDKEVQGWFQAAGLTLTVSEDIAPPAGAKEKLVVKIWLGQSVAKAHAEAA
jgi:ubiquinone/menaquinone biosynthesis C-methylase UbiE